MHLAAEHRTQPSCRRSAPRRCCRGKLDSTKTITSSTNAPFQSSGRKRGRTSGTWLSSKCFDSSAKPSSRHSRLVRITHSCCMCPTRPAQAGAGLEAGEDELVDDDGREPGQRDLQRVVVEQRDAEQRQREQDEIDRDAEDRGQSLAAAATAGQAVSTEAAANRLNATAGPPVVASLHSLRSACVPPLSHESFRTACWERFCRAHHRAAFTSDDGDQAAAIVQAKVSLATLIAGRAGESKSSRIPC